MFKLSSSNDTGSHGPAQVGGRIVEMTVGKRFDALWTLLSGAVLIALGLILIWTGLPILAIAIVVYGAGNGVWSIARGAVPLAVFGRDDYAAVMGRLARTSPRSPRPTRSSARLAG